MTQVSIFKEKYSRYTPPTNQGWAEKEQRIYDESSHSKHKTKETRVSIIKQKLSRDTPPTNSGWKKKKRGKTMEAAIQNTK